ncbi:MAG: hypothetical protein AAGB12_16070 [Pseudomonadota bacterium]
MQEPGIIFQSVFDDLSDNLSDDWYKAEIYFRLDNSIDSCSIRARYYTAPKNEMKQIRLTKISEIVDSILALREILSGNGAREKITHGYLLFTSDGDFEAKYSYQEPDWSNLTGWIEHVDFQ